MWPFYSIGLLLSESGIRLPEKRKTIPFFIIGASAYAAAIYFGMRNSAQGGWWDLAAAFSGITTTVLLSRFIETAIPYVSASLVLLGQMSMTIYILHVLAIAGTRVILLHANVNSLGMQLVAGMMAGIICPLLIGLLLTKAKAAKLVGLPTLGSLARPMPAFAGQVG
jgi:peptidoglycan/LPS O-acetylase OafA/YrhL